MRSQALASVYADHAAGAKNRWPTGRWQSGPCRRWAARAMARPHNRPGPRGCSGPKNIAPACANPREPVLGIVGGNVQMLGGDLVGHRGGLVGIAHQNQGAELLQALPRQVAARRAGPVCRRQLRGVASSTRSLQVIRILAPGACSACAIRSAAVKSARVESSAMTTTSLGPAIESMSTSP